MKTYVLRMGFLVVSAIMLVAAVGCNSKDDSVTTSKRRGVAVKVKASKF